MFESFRSIVYLVPQLLLGNASPRSSASPGEGGRSLSHSSISRPDLGSKSRCRCLQEDRGWHAGEAELRGYAVPRRRLGPRLQRKNASPKNYSPKIVTRVEWHPTQSERRWVWTFALGRRSDRRSDQQHWAFAWDSRCDSGTIGVLGLVDATLGGNCAFRGEVGWRHCSSILGRLTSAAR